MLRHVRCALSCAWIVAAASPVCGLSIGLFSTPDCSSCNLLVLPGQTSTFFVRALTEGLPEEFSFVGAGLRVAGLPPGWSAVAAPNAVAAASIGDLFGPDGAFIAFSTAMPGSCIDLYTVSLTATTLVHDAILRIEGVASWTSGRICPLIVPYCGACDLEICVDGGVLFVNSDSDCEVSTASKNWAQVKGLYR